MQPEGFKSTGLPLLDPAFVVLLTPIPFYLCYPIEVHLGTNHHTVELDDLIL
jgi:hypothetical protein